MKISTLAYGLLFAISLAPNAAGYWLGLREVPVARILPRLEARVHEHPRDAHGHYLLGRVHGAAFGQRVDSIRMNCVDCKEDDWNARERTTGAGAIGPTAGQREIAGPRLADEALRVHLSQAVRHLSIAVELAPKDALYRIGFACALDTGTAMAPRIDSTWMSDVAVGSLTEHERKEAAADLDALESDGESEREAAKARLAHLGGRAISVLSARRLHADAGCRAVIAELLSNAWRELAIENYDLAFTISIEHDRKQEFFSVENRAWLISHEAATSYMRLVRSRGVRGEAEAKHLAEVEAKAAALDAIPVIVTPILVPDRGDASLSGLFDGRTADFDLSGAGIEQTWEWPTAEASLLVWDPECSGEIGSGRQLFGPATWWMLFEDGYRALEALDGDGNGCLAAEELVGLALWRDANRNGISDAGEVQSLRARGVVALATRADGIEGLSPTCSRGAMFADNSMRPTFDWVANPIRPMP